MAIILNIDTCLENASIGISKNGIIQHISCNMMPKGHASFLHSSIEVCLKTANIKLGNIDAIAVTNGPGSYTGIRVGMATANGLAYSLGTPLITISTLNALTTNAIKYVKDNNLESEHDLFCPMIDARRMEVFTALFDKELNHVLMPCALELNENSFSDYLKDHKIFFFGNGADKFKYTFNSKAIFINIAELYTSVAEIAYRKYLLKDFTNLLNTEPFYLKGFNSF